MAYGYMAYGMRCALIFISIFALADLFHSSGRLVLSTNRKHDSHKTNHAIGFQ
jgi:hypothetical protein